MDELNLRHDFRFYTVFYSFLEDFKNSDTYWYIPKSNAISNETIDRLFHVLKIIIDKFLNVKMDYAAQDKLRIILVKNKLIKDAEKGSSLENRTARIRILFTLFAFIGLAWKEDDEDKQLIITDAGYDFVNSEERRNDIIYNQIAKFQYPNPDISNDSFIGIIPHLFILQILHKLNFYITDAEYKLFINLANDQNDLEKITKYIKRWRDLSKDEQDELINLVKMVRMRRANESEQLFELDGGYRQPYRYKRIELNFSYQIDFFCFPEYLLYKDKNITCTDRNRLEEIISKETNNIKIFKFSDPIAWYSYYGNPNERPTWYTYLSKTIEISTSEKEIASLIVNNADHLNEDELEEIRMKEKEKLIENYYFENPEEIEKGLRIFKDGDRIGRQFQTATGPIDLLCLDKKGMLVVVEIKYADAKDSAFGQILRYIGWIHSELKQGKKNVRGIILAGKFSESASYSRIGLEVLNDDYKTFIAFKRHGFALQDS